ncbi:hypothetical protein ACLMLE_13075, partial [Lysobacter capsici]
MRGSSLLLGLVCLLAFAPAGAGTIWRCETAAGERSYVSKKVKGATCTVASSYSSAASRPRNPTPVSYAPPRRRWARSPPARGRAGCRCPAHNNPPATFNGAAATMAAAGLRPGAMAPAPRT